MITNGLDVLSEASDIKEQTPKATRDKWEIRSMELFHACFLVLLPNRHIIQGSAKNEATGRKASYGKGSRKKSQKLFDAA